MEIFEVRNLKNLDDFFKSNEQFNFSYNCDRDFDDYFLKIEAFTTEQKMMSRLVHSVCNFKIHIDSKKFTEAYNGLGKDEKIPSHHNIDNPCTNDKYMISFIESRFKKIIGYLKDYNCVADDYVSLAKLSIIARGSILGKMNNVP